MTIACRKALQDDVEALYELIQGYAAKGIMLPRSREALSRNIDTFVVAQDGARLIGCGSLCRLGSDLVEIRSLGIVDGYKGQGVGSRLVDVLMAEAEAQGIPKVMALTLEASFFLKNGFNIVEKEIFPEKVWTDCVNCPKQHACDEIAVVRLTGIEPSAAEEKVSFAQI
ncbi:N-acetyltransferase [Cohnella suwonensis]|uniref:N-acetyltransferase n=1 Tax=Cohnella suwonensis TaxID=696072 RepID=A0ABW0M2V4_9BACL